MKKVEKDIAALEKKLASPGSSTARRPRSSRRRGGREKALLEAKARLEQSKKLVGEL